MFELFVRAGICLSLAAAAALGMTVSGAVVDGQSGKPIPDAFVTLGTKVVRTDANGQFRVESTGAVIGARAYGYGRMQVPVPGSNSQVVALKLSRLRPHAVYLSFWGVTSAAVREPILKLADQGLINAVVIDVKGDLGYLSFQTGVPLASAAGAQKITTISDVHEFLTALHKKGIYTIGRIVTFKDNTLCTARPELAVRRDHVLFKDREGLTWCDPFVAEVRSYNVDLGVAAAKAGFDEIEYDFVRFPDAKGVEFSEPSTDESRPRVINGFLKQAHDALVPYNVYLSADVFGYTCWNEGDTGIGQKIKDVTEVLDYVSPMLYPSGFSFGIPNYRNPVAHSYEIVRLTLDRAGQRTKVDPVRFRPWLQAFADYAFDRRRFGANEIQAQIKAAEDFGSDGWLLWNSKNVYSAEDIRAAVVPQRDATLTNAAVRPVVR